MTTLQHESAPLSFQPDWPAAPELAWPASSQATQLAAALDPAVATPGPLAPQTWDSGAVCYAPIGVAPAYRGSLVPLRSRGDGILALASTLVILAVALSAAVAIEGGLVHHDSPPVSQRSAGAASPVSSPANIAEPAAVATAAPTDSP